MSGYNNTKCCNGDMFKVPCWKTVRENATKGVPICVEEKQNLPGM